MLEPLKEEQYYEVAVTFSLKRSVSSLDVVKYLSKATSVIVFLFNLLR